MMWTTQSISWAWPLSTVEGSGPRSMGNLPPLHALPSCMWGLNDMSSRASYGTPDTSTCTDKYKRCTMMPCTGGAGQKVQYRCNRYAPQGFIPVHQHYRLRIGCLMNCPDTGVSTLWVHCWATSSDVPWRWGQGKHPFI